MLCCLLLIINITTEMEEKHGKLSRNMLLLMTQLEKEGPAFAEKLLITVAGGWVGFLCVIWSAGRTRGHDANRR